MRTVLPRSLPVAPESQPRLVNQRRRLQGHVVAFSLQLGRRERAQFAIDGLHQPVRGIGIAPAGGFQHERDVVHEAQIGPLVWG